MRRRATGVPKPVGKVHDFGMPRDPDPRPKLAQNGFRTGALETNSNVSSELPHFGTAIHICGCEYVPRDDPILMRRHAIGVPKPVGKFHDFGMPRDPDP